MFNDEPAKNIVMKKERVLKPLSEAPAEVRKALAKPVTDSNKKQWLAVYTRMHHERKVADALQTMGIESFVAMQEEMRQWKDRRKKVMRILIPMIVFVRVNEAQRLEVLSLASVSRFMVERRHHRALVIPDSQMDKFRFVLDFSDATVNVTSERFRPGERVRVIKGPLSGLEAEFVETAGKTQIVINLDALGNASVEMPVGYVEKVS